MSGTVVVVILVVGIVVLIAVAGIVFAIMTANVMAQRRPPPYLPRVLDGPQGRLVEIIPAALTPCWHALVLPDPANYREGIFVRLTPTGIEYRRREQAFRPFDEVALVDLPGLVAWGNQFIFRIRFTDGRGLMIMTGSAQTVDIALDALARHCQLSSQAQERAARVSQTGFPEPPGGAPR